PPASSLQPSRSAACYGTGRMPASEHAWAAGASQGLAPGTDGAAEVRFYLPSTVYSLATARCSAQRRAVFFFLAADFAAFLAVVFALLAGLLFAAFAAVFAGVFTEETDFLAVVFALAVSLLFVSLLSDPSLFDPVGSSRSAKLRFVSCSDLKSVSYHPLPLRRKFGADTSFLSDCFLQLGHCFSGLSLIFCRASK